jgi:proteasome lid subunit RPN8/RPN11
MQRLIITVPIRDEMIAHCLEAFPNEACGILAGRGADVLKVYRITNVEHSPVSYEMDSKEQFNAHRDMREQELSLLAIYHSHPSTHAYPSAKDVSRALWDGQPLFDNVAYVIVSFASGNPVVKAFDIGEHGVAEIEISG